MKQHDLVRIKGTNIKGKIVSTTNLMYKDLHKVQVFNEKSSIKVMSELQLELIK